MAEDKDLYSLNGEKACDVYERLRPAREGMLQIAREMSELTIPSVFPPQGYKAGDPLPGNNQSVGAQCVSVLASSLMFMAFPPGQPIMRLVPIEYAMQAAQEEDPELYGKVLVAMSRLEVAHRERLQTTTMASVYNQFLMGLLVGGNYLWKSLRVDEPTAWSPEHYVVKRSQSGMPLLTIQIEKVNLQGMDPDHRDIVMANEDTAQKLASMSEWEREVDIHSVCKLRIQRNGERSWLYWQEYEGVMLPDTEVETDYDNPPMWPGWLVPVFGSDWGRGYCEQYRGDLYSVEANGSALNDGAALAALSLILVKPGGQTTLKSIREMRNLSAIPGQIEDVGVFRTDKSADFNFVVSRDEAIILRLSRAFLMQSSVQRSGERVTKEEIVRLGTELDKALGGLYTQIAQGNQKPIIVRAVKLNEEETPNLPKIPTGIVEVRVVTGVDALGQSQEASNLDQFATSMQRFFPTAFEQRANIGEFGNRYAASLGVKPDGLLKSDDQMAQEQAQAQQASMMQSLVDKGAGPAVKGMADMAMQQGAPQEGPAPE